MRRRSVQLTALGLIGLASACGYDNDNGPAAEPYNGIAVANIDTDATMTNVNPGTGVGMFVEYATGGTWTVQFTCDTDISKLTCPWSVQAQTLDQSSIVGITDPKMTQTQPYIINYDTVTLSNVDRFTFQTAVAGTPVGFDIWLTYENYPNSFVFWIGDGALNKGITYPSFDLHPNPAR